MNGAHDCGGMMGFGPVVAEQDEPVFHAPWEARMFALMSAIGDVGGWTLDEDRAACESMHPGHYINSSYYEHWLNGLEILLHKQGLATAQEIAAMNVEMDEFKVMYDNPLTNAAITMLEPLPVGVVYILLSAALLSRKPRAAGALAASGDGAS
jgi:hypothetical protein